MHLRNAGHTSPPKISAGRDTFFHIARKASVASHGEEPETLFETTSDTFA
jgi:hypothetical protein